MSSILIAAVDAPLADGIGVALVAAGHIVEVAHSGYGARDRLFGPYCDHVIVDVRVLDGGMGLLIEQAHAAWPGCHVIAMVPRCIDFEASKLNQMGLWTPDAVLVHPVHPERLVGLVGKEASARAIVRGPWQPVRTVN